MVSCEYLGEIVRLSLKQLIMNGLLFNGKSSVDFDTHKKFTTEDISVIESR